MSTSNDTVLYRVRVPVVFDHLNDALLGQLDDVNVRFKQVIGRGVAVLGDDDLTRGKIEIWFEEIGEPTQVGLQEVADRAIELVEAALASVGLATTDDERGLSVVTNQVITVTLD